MNFMAALHRVEIVVREGFSAVVKVFGALCSHTSAHHLVDVPDCPTTSFRPLRDSVYTRNVGYLPKLNAFTGRRPVSATVAIALFAVLPALAQKSDHPITPVIVQPGAPGQPSKILPPSTRGTLPPRSQADIDFMQGMIMHHAQAVEMTALIPAHTTNKDLRLLGARISTSQSDEIKFMQRWLTVRGEPTSMAMPGMPDMDRSGHPMSLMPGMLTVEQMDALRKAKGDDFDSLFLAGMIQHHNGALIMVKDLFDTAGAGQNPEVFDFATDVDTGQRAEIRIMQSMLEKKSK